MNDSLQGKIVAVTGATGFLGSHIVESLSAAGAQIVGVVRTPEKGAWMLSEQVQFRKADLRDQASMEAAFEGCDAVVANAALAIRGRASLAEFKEANVDGVERTLRACKAAGVSRVVLVSSVGVYQVKMGVPIDENTPLRTGFRLDPSLLTTNWRYALSKSLGEQLAWELAETLDLQLTSIRPGPVYGARDKKFSARLRGLATRSWTLLPGVRVPMVHARDVADAISAALAREVSIGTAYTLGGNAHDLAKVVRTLASLLGSACRVLRVPLPGGVVFNDSLAIRDLGIQHRSLEQGLQEVVEFPQ